MASRTASMAAALLSQNEIVHHTEDQVKHHQLNAAKPLALALG
jgi:hypothetical protein